MYNVNIDSLTKLGHGRFSSAMDTAYRLAGRFTTLTEEDGLAFARQYGSDLGAFSKKEAGNSSKVTTTAGGKATFRETITLIGKATPATALASQLLTLSDLFGKGLWKDGDEKFFVASVEPVAILKVSYKF